MASVHHQVQDPLVGQVIAGRYEIMQRVGEGGMGVVYKARQTSIDRIVAIKMLNSQMAQDQNWVQRFNNEARACSQLQHPNTIRMFEFGQTSDNRPFMAMEFLDGQSLRDAISKSAPMPPARVVKILIQCCASLAEAHAIGIIHRDIKPDNVFLLSMAGSPDFVKLLDFSVAKLLQDDRMRTQAGVVFGTPQYMSPEQGRGLPLDPRADLYSLGILAYEMLTGNVPFNHENPMTVLQMHIRHQLPQLPQSVPPNVQQLVYKALEKEAGKRHQSAGEMMQHCQQVFGQVGGQGSGFGLPQGGGAPLGGQPIQMGSPQMGGAAQLGGQHGGQAGGAPQMSSPQAGGAAQPSGSAPMHVPAADPGAKTVVAGQAPAGLAEMLRKQSSANAKTIVAGINAPALPPRPTGPSGGAPSGGYPPGQVPSAPNEDQGPPKTMILQDSEGVVSFGGGSGPMPVNSQPQPMGGVAAGPGAMGHHQEQPQDGPSALYWTVCLFVGLTVGVVAYLVVLQLS